MYKQFTKSGYRSKSKYKNKTKQYNGRSYDSIREATHAEELDWRIKAGEIKEVIPQYKIDIRINGVHWRNYYIDFKVLMSDGSIQYHEVKGFETEVWKMKFRALEILQDDLLEKGAELLVIK
jgi:hypothetical protein